MHWVMICASMEIGSWRPVNQTNSRTITLTVGLRIVFIFCGTFSCKWFNISLQAEEVVLP